MKTKRILAFVAALALVVAMTGCGQQAATTTGGDAKTITSAADLVGAKIGVQEGTTGDTYVTDEVENAEVSRFKRAVDVAMDLKNGKIDAAVIDDQVAKDLVAEVDGLKILPDVLTEEEYAIAMPKGDAELVASVNAAIAKATESGLIDTIHKAYIDKDEAALAELAALEAPQGAQKLVVGTNAEFAPFEYMADDGSIVGYDIEIAKEIARQLGYELVIENMNFDSLIAALNSGKVDLVIAGMTANEERKQEVDFSENYYEAAQVIIVKE